MTFEQLPPHDYVLFESDFKNLASFQAQLFQVKLIQGQTISTSTYVQIIVASTLKHFMLLINK